MASGSSEKSPEAFQDEDKPGACRKCAENGLDCFAFLGRGVVATGSGAYQMTKQCAYPVKESLLSTADGTSNYLHPWQQKLPTESHVPTFRM
ncbi:unnamed protein product [Effrenium voratum]|nr:unnamed protein product [Effrenium voratum]|eukprot:CAMPEP_0181399348 /NCGR_PEP_ID=MMETSP1110-20121109/1543_1 /TAXON_ID=174948 /ORGANISM="Symbiodinium sp., Strain CCMP421" /LENGTH=91 /DNA_ID=CAMNT_0023521393 /DNA_START=26 /DNA_END=301 /DNA_ORIENTATION=+